MCFFRLFPRVSYRLSHDSISYYQSFSCFDDSYEMVYSQKKLFVLETARRLYNLKRFNIDQYSRWCRVSEATSHKRPFGPSTLRFDVCIGEKLLQSAVDYLRNINLDKWW